MDTLKTDYWQFGETADGQQLHKARGSRILRPWLPQGTSRNMHSNPSRPGSCLARSTGRSYNYQNYESLFP